jgi:hypothetical protein
MDATSEQKARKRVNQQLAVLGKTYHDGIPLQQVDEILTIHGFKATEPAIYCGRDGRSSEWVGDHSLLILTWHKMEPTGHYEIVAYVS